MVSYMKVAPRDLKVRSKLEKVSEDDEETDDEKAKAKAACNLAIAAALGSRDPVVIAERDRVCGG